MSLSTGLRRLPTAGKPAAEDTATTHSPTTDEPAAEVGGGVGGNPRAADSPRSADAVSGTRPADADPPLDEASSGQPAAGRRRWRLVFGWSLTAVAFLIVQLALVFPNRTFFLTPKAFARIPVEALIIAAILLVLPARARKVTATLLGVLLGLLTILKVLDMGFFSLLARPFNLLYDWSTFGNGMDFVAGSYGRGTAIAAAVGVGAVVIAVLAVMTLSIRRLASVLAGHETTATRAVAVLTVFWVACALFGYSVQGLPRTSDITATFAYNTLRTVPNSLLDQRTFSKELAVDAFENTPGNQLLPALRGKDVVFTFIESYGQGAVENPQISALLDTGSRRLEGAGFSAQTGYLTSPTAGGGSWLAHSTLYSGLWINNEARYRSLVKSDRLTLNHAFQRADWRSVGVMPGLTGYWPEGTYFGYDKIYDARNLGFRGPKYQWSSIPDQYILSKLQRSELTKPGHKPVVAEVETTSSHAPWTYVPKLTDWNTVGDGQTTAGPRPDFSQHDADWTRAQYNRTIEYSLNTMISYVETYGDDNLVLVFLGDHQPISLVAGNDATHNVPITIVSRDKNVLNRISGWGWKDGLKPDPNGPIWRMDAFRDRFLTAFGSQPTPATPPAK